MEKKEEREFTVRRRLDRKLLAYSVAAGSALAVAQPASAAIQYSGPKDITINWANPFETIDLDGGGVDDFSFWYSIGWWWYWLYQGVGMYNIGPSNKVIGQTSFWWDEPYRLAHGDLVSAGAPGDWLDGGALNLRSFWYYGTYPYGDFIDQKGYLGVKLDINGSNHYGWIAYEGTGFFEGKITGWAYEDVAGKAIRAGDTGEVTVPTLNEWGIIILMGLILLEGARRLRPRREET